MLLKRNFRSSEDSVIINRALKQVADSGYNLRVATRHLFTTLAGAISLLLILVGFCINFYAVYTNQLPASWFYTFPDVAQKNHYFSIYLTKTWTHLSVFMIGLIGGHLCRSAIQLNSIRLPTKQMQSSPNGSQLDSNKSHSSSSAIMSLELCATHTRSEDAESSNCSSVNSRGSLRTAVWIAAIACQISVIFSTFSWSTKEAPSTLVAASYDAGARLVWSLSMVALMMQLCLPAGNKSSWLIRVLSSRFCLVTGRLSFLAYLISPYINTFVLAVEEQSLFPSLLIIFHLIVGNIVIIYFMSFILAIVIEQPLRRFMRSFVLNLQS